jgi:hypothetical protein
MKIFKKAVIASTCLASLTGAMLVADARMNTANAAQVAYACTLTCQTDGKGVLTVCNGGICINTPITDGLCGKDASTICSFVPQDPTNNPDNKNIGQLCGTGKSNPIRVNPLPPAQPRDINCPPPPASPRKATAPSVLEPR